METSQWMLLRIEANPTAKHRERKRCSPWRAIEGARGTAFAPKKRKKEEHSPHTPYKKKKRTPKVPIKSGCVATSIATAEKRKIGNTEKERIRNQDHAEKAKTK